MQSRGYRQYRDPDPSQQQAPFGREGLFASQGLSAQQGLLTAAPGLTPRRDGGREWDFDLSDNGLDRQRGAANDWSRWVVIFGVPQNEDARMQCVRIFMAFGEIMERKVGRGNFLFLKYGTALEASKAAAQNPTEITPELLVGVVSLTEDLATRFGLSRSSNFGYAQDILQPRSNNASLPYAGPGRNQIHRRVHDGIPHRPYMVSAHQIPSCSHRAASGSIVPPNLRTRVFVWPFRRWATTPTSCARPVDT